MPAIVCTYGDAYLNSKSLNLVTCGAHRIVARIDPTASGPVFVRTSTGSVDRYSNEVPLSLWRGVFKYEENQTNGAQGAGTLVYGMDYDLRIRADVHDAKNRSRVPFTCAPGSLAKSHVSGKAVQKYSEGVSATLELQGGTATSELISSEDMSSRQSAERDYLSCEGYFDLNRRELVWHFYGGVKGGTAALTSTVMGDVSKQTDPIYFAAGTWGYFGKSGLGVDRGGVQAIALPNSIWGWTFPLDSGFGVAAGKVDGSSASVPGVTQMLSWERIVR
jgi:hypothetical protein